MLLTLPLCRIPTIHPLLPLVVNFSLLVQVRLTPTIHLIFHAPLRRPLRPFHVKLPLPTRNSNALAVHLSPHCHGAFHIRRHLCNRLRCRVGLCHTRGVCVVQRKRYFGFVGVFPHARPLSATKLVQFNSWRRVVIRLYILPWHTDQPMTTDVAV